jgi:choline dehydrogenase-like flavoprotein
MTILPDGAYHKPGGIFSDEITPGRVFDVAILGSGIGGGVLAHNLAWKGLDILLLEAGDLLFPVHLSSLPRKHNFGEFGNIWDVYDTCYRTKNAAGSESYQGGQALCLGGRSVFWGGVIPRMRAYEFAAWPSQVRNDLINHYYQEAELMLSGQRAKWPVGYPEDGYARKLLTAVVSSLGENFSGDLVPLALGTPQISPALSTGIFSTADLLVELHLAEHLPAGLKKPQILLNNQATKLNVDKSGVVKSVSAFDRKTQRIRDFSAKKYVVSCGTVESTRLLLDSNLNSPKIGCGISDHPIQYCRFWLPPSSPFYEESSGYKFIFQHKDAAENAHSYNILLGVGSEAFLARTLSSRISEQSRRERRNHRFCEIVFLYSSPLIEENKLSRPPAGEWEMQMKMERNRITKELQEETQGLTTRVIKSLSGEPMDSSGFTLVTAPLGNVAHEVGAARIADSVDYGVVDANLDVYGWPKAYVFDLSVFPSSPAANPTLTLAALAMRLGDHLGENLETRLP